MSSSGSKSGGLAAAAAQTVAANASGKAVNSLKKAVAMKQNAAAVEASEDSQPLVSAVNGGR